MARGGKMSGCERDVRRILGDIERMIEQENEMFEDGVTSGELLKIVKEHPAYKKLESKLSAIRAELEKEARGQQSGEYTLTRLVLLTGPVPTGGRSGGSDD